VGRGEKRARDADRNLAIEFVQNAWVDGQLTREEHEERVERVLRATTVADVEREVRDLQGPGGSIWRPTVPPGTPLVAVEPTPLAPPAPSPTAAEQAEADAALVRKGRGVILGAAALLVGALMIGNAASDDEYAVEGSWEDSRSAVVAMLDLEAMADQAEVEFGGTEVHSVTLAPDAAGGEDVVTVVVPREGEPGEAYEVVWDVETDSWATDRTETKADGSLIDLRDLSEVDLDLINADAWGAPGYVEEVDLLVRADTYEGQQVCVTATAGGDGPDTTLRYDCDGNQL